MQYYDTLIKKMGLDDNNFRHHAHAHGVVPQKGSPKLKTGLLGDTRAASDLFNHHHHQRYHSIAAILASIKGQFGLWNHDGRRRGRCRTCDESAMEKLFTPEGKNVLDEKLEQERKRGIIRVGDSGSDDDEGEVWFSANDFFDLEVADDEETLQHSTDEFHSFPEVLGDNEELVATQGNLQDSVESLEKFPDIVDEEERLEDQNIQKAAAEESLQDSVESLEPFLDIVDEEERLEDQNVQKAAAEGNLQDSVECLESFPDIVDKEEEVEEQNAQDSALENRLQKFSESLESLPDIADDSDEGARRKDRDEKAEKQIDYFVSPRGIQFNSTGDARVKSSTGADNAKKVPTPHSLGDFCEAHHEREGESGEWEDLLDKITISDSQPNTIYIKEDTATEEVSDFQHETSTQESKSEAENKCTTADMEKLEEEIRELDQATRVQKKLSRCKSSTRYNIAQICGNNADQSNAFRVTDAMEREWRDASKEHNLRFQWGSPPRSAPTTVTATAVTSTEPYISSGNIIDEKTSSQKENVVEQEEERCMHHQGEGVNLVENDVVLNVGTCDIRDLVGAYRKRHPSKCSICSSASRTSLASEG